MTHTEQDKMSDEELTKAVYEAMQVPYLSERHDAIKQLITADRKRVALEVRLDELIWSTGVTYKYEKGRQIIQDRIAELKAKQEEV